MTDMTVESWNPVGVWTYDISLVTCDICREKITSCCAECSTSKNTNISCNVTKGECQHGFHEHCIKRWLSSGKNNMCPICKTPWNVRTANLDNDEDWRKLFADKKK